MAGDHGPRCREGAGRVPGHEVPARLLGGATLAGGRPGLQGPAELPSLHDELHCDRCLEERGAGHEAPPAQPGGPDRKARMYYTAARQYAALQGLPFRSPYRLLDSASAHKAFLFAKQQGLEVPFLMRVYVQGWGSGWRDYEIESLEQLRDTLSEAGAHTDGFEAFMAPDGAAEAELVSTMAKADTAGFTGVPHYVFDDTASGRELGLFGREHLALIREKLGAEGLARSPEVRPEFSHTWRGTLAKL